MRESLKRFTRFLRAEEVKLDLMKKISAEKTWSRIEQIYSAVEQMFGSNLALPDRAWVKSVRSRIDDLDSKLNCLTSFLAFLENDLRDAVNLAGLKRLVDFDDHKIDLLDIQAIENSFDLDEEAFYHLNWVLKNRLQSRIIADKIHSEIEDIALSEGTGETFSDDDEDPDLIDLDVPEDKLDWRRIVEAMPKARQQLEDFTLSLLRESELTIGEAEKVFGEVYKEGKVDSEIRRLAAAFDNVIKVNGDRIREVISQVNSLFELRKYEKIAVEIRALCKVLKVKEEEGFDPIEKIIQASQKVCLKVC